MCLVLFLFKMSTILSVLQAVIITIVSVVQALKDGNEVSPCDYPGLVAVVAPPDLGACNGIVVGGTMLVPPICGQGIDGMLSNSGFTIAYGDGSQNITVPPGTPKGYLEDGVYHFKLPAPLVGKCSGDATVYDQKMSLDFSSCTVVGYGTTNLYSPLFTGHAFGASITKSTSAPCCQVIMDTLTTPQKGVYVDESSPLNCVTSTGTGCSISDLGSPIYCKTTQGQRVVAGLMASTPCESGLTFLAHDMTGMDGTFKFGLSA